MDPLHEQLLERLESGQIHPAEMEHFRDANRAASHDASHDATVDQELMWILFSVDQLEKHRLRLVEHLRCRRTAA